MSRHLLRLAIIGLVALALSWGRDAIAPAPVLASGPVPATIYAVSCNCDGTQGLFRFESNTPGNTTRIGSLSGFVDPEEEVGSMAFEPASGVLWMVSTLFRVYTIDVNSAALTFRYGPLPLDAQFLAFLSFDPLSGQARIITDTEANYRLNVATGALTTDTSLQFGCGCGYLGLANSSPYPGATATTVFSVDFGNSALVTVGGRNGTPSPNTGTIIQVAPLGMPGDNTLIAAMLTMAGGQQNTMYAQLYGIGDFLTLEPTLYTIDPATAAVSKIGSIGGIGPDDQVVGLAAVPGNGVRMQNATQGVLTTAGQVDLTIQRAGSTIDPLSVSFSTPQGSAVPGVNYVANSGSRIRAFCRRHSPSRSC
jgi:hypothetical protein